MEEEYSATHPIRFTPYKITPPYFQPKNAKIIDPTFWVNKSTYICVKSTTQQKVAKIIDPTFL